MARMARSASVMASGAPWRSTMGPRGAGRRIDRVACSTPAWRTRTLALQGCGGESRDGERCGDASREGARQPRVEPPPAGQPPETARLGVAPTADDDAQGHEMNHRRRPSRTEQRTRDTGEGKQTEVAGHRHHHLGAHQPRQAGGEERGRGGAGVPRGRHKACHQHGGHEEHGDAGDEPMLLDQAGEGEVAISRRQVLGEEVVGDAGDAPASPPEATAMCACSIVHIV